MNTNTTISLEIDEAMAVKRIGDRNTFVEIAHALAEHLPGAVAQLESFIAAGDLQTARLRAHSLKSNCATVGSESLRAECDKLEHAIASENIQEISSLTARLAPALLDLGIKLSQLR